MQKMRIPWTEARLGGDIRPLQLLILVAQLAVVVLVIHVYRIEQIHGYLKVTPLILGGFVVHALLPKSYRRPFFLGLSLVGVWMLLGTVNAVGLVALGLVLIALCHLPVALSVRVALLVVVGAVLAAIRAGRLSVPGWDSLAPLVLPLLGAIFMFRLAIYLYDTRHERTPATLWERLSYFFMLPNFCFLLFPVIDYQTFRRTYYDRESVEIYQKGVFWVFRGVSHILVYRLVYYYFTPSPNDVVDLAGVVQMMLTTYLLYLRISGQFHVIVGTLCLFGYNLPETHHLYYLASSLTDYWRRINIYWKDFMMKLFYYPAFMKLRKRGMTMALVLATVWVFLGTWLLHAYQWFWLRGAFLLTWPDALFWLILGSLMVLSVVLEARRGRTRSLGQAAWDPRRAVVHALKVLGLFMLLTALWSFWSSATVGDFLRLLGVAASSSAASWLVFVAVLAALFGIGVLVQYLESRGVRLSPARRIPSRRRSAWATAVGAVLLLVAGQPTVQGRLGAEAGPFLASLQEARFNQRDQELLERGYYEGLLADHNFASALWRVQSKRPPEWDQTISEAGAARQTGTMLRTEMLPDVETTFKAATLRTNAWGMRDRPYAREKPPGTFRIALLGASDEMGWGVEDGETFENVLEDRLNAQPGAERFEILNFAVPGYAVLQKVMLMEDRVPSFEPDAVFLMDHPQYARRLQDAFSRSIMLGETIPYPYLQAVIARIGVGPGMNQEAVIRALLPVTDELVVWAYREIVAACRSHNITPVWVFIPSTDPEHAMANAREHLEPMARDAGFVTVSIEDAFDGQDPRAIQLAPWDKHPNARGHRLIADRLFEVLQDHEAALTRTPAATPAE